METLKEQFENVTKKYVNAFEEKTELVFEDWVGRDVGGIGLFSDYFINFDVIRYHIDNDINNDLFFSWYDNSIERAMKKDHIMNYPSYLKLKESTDAAKAIDKNWGKIK